ncbi:MAG: hypothetical protein ACTSU2_09375 [Promethearchaeota archaeon]
MEYIITATLLGKSSIARSRSYPFMVDLVKFIHNWQLFGKNNVINPLDSG